jgi:hypothetical protein
MKKRSDGGSMRLRASSLKLAPGLEDSSWAFEDQLKNRSIEKLGIDLVKVDQELEDAREKMSSTAEEKKLHHAPSLYGEKQKSAVDHKMATSHAIDLVHGLIEGYVIVQHRLLFCSLRGGRMLFWEDRNDVGHVPPKSVWDVSGMRIFEVRTHGVSNKTSISRKIERRYSSKIASGKLSELSTKKNALMSSKQLQNLSSLKQILESKEDGNEDDEFDKNDDDIEKSERMSSFMMSGLVDEYLSSDGDDDDSDDEELCPWEWTIVLTHLHRTKDMAEEDEDPMKLAIHGVKDHSDHDRQDWEDALSVVSATLNPIALRRAHILEELSNRRRHRAKANERSTNLKSSNSSSKTSGEQNMMNTISNEHRRALHDHRDQIICLGYNEMFPAVLALADGLGKEVVVVEYDPVRINAVKNRYNEKKRNNDAVNLPSNQRLEEHVKSSSTDTSVNDSSSPTLSVLRGVACVYADIHDPECWEELEMDEAFVIVCTMKGARHAEKALMKWLKKHNSETIFVGFSDSNIEAIHLYNAGAHYVIQADALAMRSTKQIFLETVARHGDCSRLVVAGAAHSNRLQKLQKEDEMKFRYET